MTREEKSVAINEILDVLKSNQNIFHITQIKKI